VFALLVVVDNLVALGRSCGAVASTRRGHVK
jgi:hypothetical protein